MYYNKPRVYHSFNVEKRTDNDIPIRLEAILDDPDTAIGDKDFAKSLKQYWDRNSCLTARQFEAIERLENKKIERSGDDEFRKNFTEEQREILNIVAKYYVSLGKYYIDLALKVIADPKFVPSRKQYATMCENKYAASIVENYKIDPKFDNGEIVIVRDTYRGYMVVPGKVLMVVNATDVVGPAKGSRIYVIQDIQTSETFKLEEKDIKKHRKY